jgi:hypothetical protein
MFASGIYISITELIRGIVHSKNQKPEEKPIVETPLEIKKEEKVEKEEQPKTKNIKSNPLIIGLILLIPIIILGSFLKPGISLILIFMISMIAIFWNYSKQQKSTKEIPKPIIIGETDKKVEVIICPKCKTENDSDSEFCKKCGRKLK